METTARRQTKSRRRFCEHCQETLPRTTYFQHRRLYFNKDTGEWSSSTLNNTMHSDSEDSTSLDEPFSDEESGSMVDTHQWQECFQEGKVVIS